MHGGTRVNTSENATKVYARTMAWIERWQYWHNITRDTMEETGSNLRHNVREYELHASRMKMDTRHESATDTLLRHSWRFGTLLEIMMDYDSQFINMTLERYAALSGV